MRCYQCGAASAVQPRCLSRPAQRAKREIARVRGQIRGRYSSRQMPQRVHDDVSRIVLVAQRCDRGGVETEAKHVQKDYLPPRDVRERNHRDVKSVERRNAAIYRVHNAVLAGHYVIAQERTQHLDKKHRAESPQSGQQTEDARDADQV